MGGVDVATPRLNRMPDEYGPEILALVERAGRLTPSDLTALAAAWAATWNGTWAAWDAAQAAARAAVATTRYIAMIAARDAAMTAVRDAARDARYAAWATAGDAAGAAALALAVRDLIGQHGFTRDYYDALTGPWALVVGRVHPDDPDPRATHLRTSGCTCPSEQAADQDQNCALTTCPVHGDERGHRRWKGEED
jgi:hypothetical protein